jgi:hypothetical protein
MKDIKVSNFAFGKACYFVPRIRLAKNLAVKLNNVRYLE